MALLNNPILFVITWLFVVCCGTITAVLFRRGWINWNVRRQGPIIDPNHKCPGCGGRKGTLKFVVTSQHGAKVPKGDPMIEHTCNICGAKFYQATVSKPDGWYMP